MSTLAPLVTVHQDMKRCSRCGLKQRRSAFWRNTAKADGLQQWCKLCCREYGGRPRDPFAAYAGDTHKGCGGTLLPHSVDRDGVIMRCSSCRMAGVPV